MYQLCAALGSGASLLPVARPALPGSRGRRTPVAACLRGSGADRQQPDRPVFETWPPCGETTLFEARDAIEACVGLEGAEGEACFAVFGLDCERTRKWYPTVSKLEAQLAMTDEDEADDDDTMDEKVNPWGLPQPLNEFIALWSDVADDIKRMHDASAHG